MVLPFIKVASLVIKTASKPVAKQIKAHAATNPLFQKAIITAAQGWNKAEGRMALFVGERIGEARPLNVNAAIDLGSELASEFFLLSVAVGLLALENYRSSQKDAAKAADLSRKLESLQTQIDAQKSELKKCREALGWIEDHPSSLDHSSLSPTTSSTSTSSLLSLVPKSFSSFMAAASKAFSGSSASSPLSSKP